jgi:multiple sugar transport system permease protein
MTMIDSTQDSAYIAPPVGSQPKKSQLEKRQSRWGWVFIAPWIVGFLLFVLLPLVLTMLLSLSDFDVTEPDAASFIGLGNYARLFTDRMIRVGLAVTIKYAVLAIPITMGFALLVAALVNSKFLAGKNLFRTFFYMPYQIPIVAATLVFNGVLNTETGWMNLALEAVGIPGPNWLNSLVWIYPALVLIGLWGIGNVMLTLLAGMQGVPAELYDAARVDGANGIQQFTNITLPMISPVIFYNLVLMVIGAFKYFDIPYVLKDGSGDPGNATMFYNLYLYKTAFVYNDMGYGTAQAWGLFVVVILLTIGLFWAQSRWVYYAGEKD